MIGVLALQGAYQKHYEMIKNLDVEVMFVRTLEELSQIDAMILPGGESTTQGKLLKWYGLLEPLKQRILGGMPVFGTCAGMILLAKKNNLNQPNMLEVMDIEVERNAYGSQIESFETQISLKNHNANFPAIFIRAPKITKVGKNVEVLAEYEKNPILVRENNILAASFHPELSNDNSVHRIFLLMLN
jgi:5'-phosphate synthase pdxT subunit